MCCCHRGRPGTGDRGPGTGSARHPSSVSGLIRDQRGSVAIEGLVVIALLAGVFFACLLIGQWGASLQSGQMGARLLAFDAGDVEFARLGRESRQPVQEFITESWDTLYDPTNANWLGGMFALPHDFYRGRVSDTAHGRLPSQAALFSFVPATMGYLTRDWTASANTWAMPESTARLTFINLAYYVGYWRVEPEALDSTKAEPIPSSIPVLETIYVRLGIR